MSRRIEPRLLGYGILGALVVLAAPLSVQAESQGRLTLEVALQQALQSNPELQVVRRELGVAQGVLTQARIYPFNPALELEGNGGRSRNVDGPEEHRTVGGFSVGLSQVIEIQGQREIRTDIATANVGETEWKIRDGERRVLADVTRAFAKLLEAWERLKLAEETVALAKETRKTAGTRFEAGEVPRLDLLRADVELRRVLTRKVAEERRVAAARKKLNLLLGRAPDAPPDGRGASALTPYSRDPGQASSTGPRIEAGPQGLRGSTPGCSPQIESSPCRAALPGGRGGAALRRGPWLR